MSHPRNLHICFMWIKVQKHNFLNETIFWAKISSLLLPLFIQFIPAKFRPHSDQDYFPYEKGFGPKLNFRRQSFGIFQHSYVGASWHWLWDFKLFVFFVPNISFKFFREVMMWSETFLLINLVCWTIKGSKVNILSGVWCLWKYTTWIVMIKIIKNVIDFWCLTVWFPRFLTVHARFEVFPLTW